MLVIEDNAGDADLVDEFLRESHLEVELTFTQRMGTAITILAEEPVDCVLLDLGLPDVRGTETVLRLRAVAADVPLVVLTGTEDAAIAGACVRLGAQEYLEKARLGPRSLAQAIELAMLRVSEARARNELLQHDRLRSVGLLAAGIAHEVNNPLTVLQMNLENLGELTERGEVGDGLRSLLRSEVAECRDSASRIATIVGRLNSFARADEDQPKTLVAIDQAIRDAYRLTEHRWRAHCHVETDLHHTPAVLGYPGELTQVFVNLLLNAAQAIEAGGGSVIRVRSRIAGGMVEVRVEDDGPGMEARVLRRVFDPFYTTKARAEGTGLGLALCQGIIKGHGGTLQAESNPGEGSTFTVRLPMSQGALPRIVRPSTLAPARGRHRVLLVDDDPVLLRVIGRLLRKHHDVVAADGGEAAIAEMATGATFDVVLCDLTMPKVDGGTVYQWIVDHRPELEDRFVLMSGGASDAVVSSLPELRRLGKPFDREKVLATISEVADRPLDDGPTTR